jgi:hypothetical protein
MALGLFDFPVNDAKTFSIIFVGARLLPLLLGGAIATALTGSKIGELRDRAKQCLDAHNARVSHPPTA